MSAKANGRALRFVLLFASFCFACIFVCDATVFAQEAAAAAPAEQPNMLTWLIKVSGIIGLFIFALSIYFVAVVVQNIIELRMSYGAPPEMVAATEGMINEQNIQGALEAVDQDDSFFSQTLAAGLHDLKYGLDEARDKLERTSEALTAKMERKISILAVLGTLGPMIGLLGTLKGMIAAFSAIALSGVNLEAAKVAEAISEALVLTFEGVLLSIPAIFFYSMFRNRISMISIEATTLAEDQLKAAAKILKPKAPQPAR